MPEPESRELPGPDPESFDPEEADVDPRLRERRRYATILRENGYEDPLVLSREHVADLGDRHLAILEHLRDHEPASVRQLADELDADKGTISRNLATLAELAIVDFVEDGRSKRPVLEHDTVAIEPLV